MTLLEYMVAEPSEVLSVRWHPTHNATLKPSEVKLGSHKRVWWQCEQGHSWEAPVYSVAMNRCDCPYCAGKKAMPGETDLATLHPEVMKQWDTERNAELDPEFILPSSHEKVWWRCELGHSWQAAPFSRTRTKASGCPYCTGKKVLAGFNDLATMLPGLAEEWYQPMNGELTPRDVTPGSNKKVWWRCDKHHVWQAAVYSRARTNGTGCPVCAGTTRRSRVIHLVDGQQK